MQRRRIIRQPRIASPLSDLLLIAFGFVLAAAVLGAMGLIP